MSMRTSDGRDGRRLGLTLLLLALLALLLAACGAADEATPEAPVAQPATAVPAAGEPTAATGLANPASVFCEEQGGRLEIRQDAAGNQAGYCIFPDGSECDEWAYFRGECAPGGQSASSEEVTPEATAVEPGQGAQVAPADVPTDDLVAAMESTLPEGAFDGVAVLPLESAAGQPLWAAYSVGLRNHDLDPLPSHVVAVYTHGDGGWQERARFDLDTPGTEEGTGVSPDYVGEGDVSQAFIDPSLTWLQVEGGAGAHSGTYELLSFDGQDISLQVATTAASPGVGTLEDLNGDGSPEVILDASDPFIFCYACGVRKPGFQVYTWDATNRQMLELSIEPMLMGQADNPLRQPVNDAVAYAQAGLWPDALAAITAAQDAAAQVPDPADTWTLDWDAALIRLYHDANREAVDSSAYPLLNQVFYGDYAAAVDLMRDYGVLDIFSPDTPLIQGTVAEGWEDAVSSNILDSATAAVAVKPDLAPAYFLRGWAEFLADPADPAVTEDLARAAELAPEDPLYAQAATMQLAPSPAAASSGVTTPTRIEFEPGGSSATVGGDLVARGVARYVLRAQAGQTMQVVLNSPGDAVLTVAGADSTLLASMSDGATEWQGTLPTGQDYVLGVTNRGAATTYTLTVSVEPLGQ